MSSKFIFTFFLLVIGYQCVDGATCTTDSTCQVTDYTESTCTGSVCNCISSSYVAIRTGCALDKPVIFAETGRSNQVIIGKTLTLTCKLADASTFEWYKDNNLKTNDSIGTFSVTTTTSTDGGSYTCKGKAANNEWTSQSSDAFKVEILMLGNEGISISSIQPTIFVPTTSIVSGDSLDLGCYNIPMGAADTDITYTVTGTAAARSKSVTIDSNNQGKDVTCTIAGGIGYSFSIGTSAADKLPKLITNIQSVAVTLGDQSITEIGIGTTSSVTLTCTLTPDTTYLGTSPDVKYTWLKDGKSISSAISNTYILKDAGTYGCTATLKSQITIASAKPVTVTKRTDELTISASKPIKGGRVILTCGQIRTDGVTYQWSKDNVNIERQFDRTLQIDNIVDTTDDGTYKCTIFYNKATLATFSNKFTTQTTIEKPTITHNGTGASLCAKVDYVLSCNTDSETIGMTYEWTVKGVVSKSVTGKNYSLPAISSCNNGDYTCRAKFKTDTSVASDVYKVAVIAGQEMVEVSTFVLGLTLLMSEVFA